MAGRREVNGSCVLASVARGLAPTPKPRGIVIRDNLGSHEAKAVRRAIRTTGATLLFVAKYAPDLNPIEQLFAKVKLWPRNAAKRTRDALLQCRRPNPRHHLSSRTRK